MAELAAWMESTWISKTLFGISWLWPASESLHFIGLCMTPRVVRVVWAHYLFPVHIVRLRPSLLLSCPTQVKGMVSRTKVMPSGRVGSAHSPA